MGGNMHMLWKKFAEKVRAHEKEAVCMILDAERNIKEMPVKKLLNYDDVWNIIHDFAIYVLQMVIFPHAASSGNLRKWAFVNTVKAQILAFCIEFRTIYVYDYRLKKLNDKIIKTSQDFNKLFLALVNFLFHAVFFGPKFCEHFELIAFMIVLIPPILWISRRMSMCIHRKELH